MESDEGAGSNFDNYLPVDFIVFFVHSCHRNFCLCRQQITGALRIFPGTRQKPGLWADHGCLGIEWLEVVEQSGNTQNRNVCAACSGRIGYVGGIMGFSSLSDEWGKVELE